MTTPKLSTPALCGAVSIPQISMEKALELIAKDGCENFTSGLGSCFEVSRLIGATDSANSVCHACLAYAALKSQANRT